MIKLYDLKELIERNLLSRVHEDEFKVYKVYFFDYTEYDIQKMLGSLLLSLTNSNVTSSIKCVPLIEDNPIQVALCVFRDDNSIRETFKSNGVSEPLWVSREDIIQSFRKCNSELDELVPLYHVIICFCRNIGVDPDIILKEVE